MVSIGNPVMDVALIGGRKAVDDYINKCADLGVDIIEISSIARSIDDDDVCTLIEKVSKKGIKVLNEIGVAFAHSEVNEESIFVQRLINQSKKFQCWLVEDLVESEGLTENMNKENYRWNIIDRIISPLKLSQFMVEADDQDVFCKYIEIYGPNVNMMIDFRLLKIEDENWLWSLTISLGKVVKY